MLETMTIKKRSKTSLKIATEKAQKDLLRIALLEGADPAFREITPWREKLLKKEIIEILK